MNTLKIFSIALIASATVSQAQDLDQAKKALDAEQYEKAKSVLKSIIQAKPSNGKAAFLLGNVYLKQNIEDSAKIYFQKGLAASEGAKFNNIGLGQLDLDNGKSADAKLKFDAATKDVKKKDVEEYIYVAQAYTNSSTPDYKSAIAILNKAKVANPNDANVLVALGDAFYGDKNQNEAYVSYRSAFQMDNTLIRAKMQLGVLLKGARNFTEATKAYDEVIALNPNYGPVYRELAETYYLWGNMDAKKYTEYIQKSLGYYEKYMSLTDYSLSSRMRHADFLILAKDYKALEVEANKMKELDNVNPRILRYLGYSAYENGNTDAAITALTEFTTKGTNKVIAKDYYYLALARTKKAISEDGKTIDATLFTSAIADLKKAVEMDPVLANDLNAIGKNYFSQKQYAASASIFEIAITNPNSKNFLEDNIYYGLNVYTENRGKTPETQDKVALDKADKAIDIVIAQSPDYLESYLYKARINNTLEKDEVTLKSYQQFADLVIAKGAESITANKAKLTESYNNMAAIYANSNKSKALEYFNKTLALDPANEYALKSIKLLK
jgi:tetratricopeptide (TPR) repeat protein